MSECYRCGTHMNCEACHPSDLSAKDAEIARLTRERDEAHEGAMDERRAKESAESLMRKAKSGAQEHYNARLAAEARVAELEAAANALVEAEYALLWSAKEQPAVADQFNKALAALAALLAPAAERLSDIEIGAIMRRLAEEEATALTPAATLGATIAPPPATTNLKAPESLSASEPPTCGTCEGWKEIVLSGKTIPCPMCRKDGAK